MLSKNNLLFDNETKVQSSVNRLKSDTVWQMNSRKVELREMLRKTVDFEKLSFAGLSKRKLVDIQLEVFEIAVSRSVIWL